MARKTLSFRPKTFGQLTEKDSIYYVSPVTHEVEGFKIREITGATEEQIKLVPSLKTAVKITVYHNSFALQSPDIDKIPQKMFVMDGTLNAQLTVVKVAFTADNQPMMPVMFFADINLANEWKSQG